MKRVADEVLDDLWRRLDATRWPDDGPGGFELSDARELAAYWRDGYDWRAAVTRAGATCPSTKAMTTATKVIDMCVPPWAILAWPVVNGGWWPLRMHSELKQGPL